MITIKYLVCLCLVCFTTTNSFKLRAKREVQTPETTTTKLQTRPINEKHNHGGNRFPPQNGERRGYDKVKDQDKWRNDKQKNKWENDGRRNDDWNNGRRPNQQNREIRSKRDVAVIETITKAPNDNGVKLPPQNGGNQDGLINNGRNPIWNNGNGNQEGVNEWNNERRPYYNPYYGTGRGNGNGNQDRVGEWNNDRRPNGGGVRNDWNNQNERSGNENNWNNGRIGGPPGNWNGRRNNFPDNDWNVNNGNNNRRKPSKFNKGRSEESSEENNWNDFRKKVHRDKWQKEYNNRRNPDGRGRFDGNNQFGESWNREGNGVNGRRPNDQFNPNGPPSIAIPNNPSANNAPPSAKDVAVNKPGSNILPATPASNNNEIATSPVITNAASTTK